MKKTKGNKKVIYSLSLILMLAMTFFMVLTQSSLAQVGVPQPEKTSGYIDVAPRLIGVGQTATVNLFIYPIPTDIAYLAYYDGYRGVTVTFVRPDGTEDTFMPVDGTGVYDPGQTQSLGAIYFFYAPNMAGDWSVSFTMPDQNLTDITGTVLYEGCTSNTAYFTVQTDPVLAGLVNGYPWSPLPNNYWSYPISSNNREWSQISGDWLGSSSLGAPVLGDTCRMWQPYGSGPTTGHILWKQPLRMGGIIGGAYGSISYGAQGSSFSSVIMQGKLFINIPNTGKFECVDLATGEVLYTADGGISYGVHIPGNPYIQSGLSPTGNVVLESSYGHSPTAYLFQSSGGAWNYYDPFTGNKMVSIQNATGIMNYYLVDGSSVAYAVRGAAPNQELVCWNMSKATSTGTFAVDITSVSDWPTGIEWTVPLPASMIMQMPKIPGQYASSATRDSYVYGMSSDWSTILIRRAPNEYGGYSATDGTSLWNLTLNYPAQSNQEIALYPKSAFIIFDPTDMTFNCYSLLTGNLLWTSDTFNDSTWATAWTVYLGETSDNDNFYAIFPDGTARAYSLTDGHEVWRSEPIPSTEYPNNALPTVQNVVLVDGKLYIFAGYASSYKINPISRLGVLLCLDATNGDTVFTLPGGIRVSSTANGYVIGTGDYDGDLYCVSKGPTSTSVIIQDDVVANGDTVHIKGNVLDQSPAAQNYGPQVMFPNGVPAVADEDMSEFMDYLYMQNATLLNDPPMPNGVPVNLYVVKPDDTEDWITTVTSDSYGNYAHEYIPQTEGVYKVIAKFEGSESYWPSSTETSFTATKAPSQGQQETEEPSAEALAFPTTEVAIVAAVAVVAVVAIGAYWALRKRK